MISKFFIPENFQRHNAAGYCLRTATVLLVFSAILAGCGDSDGDGEGGDRETTVSCQTLPGSGLFMDPYKIGLIESGTKLTVNGCQGFPTYSRVDRFLFTTDRLAQATDTLTIKFYLDEVNTGYVAASILEPETGWDIYDSTAFDIEIDGSEVTRTINLYQLPPSIYTGDGPLPKGSWILRTDSPGFLRTTSSYNITIDLTASKSSEEGGESAIGYEAVLLSNNGVWVGSADVNNITSGIAYQFFANGLVNLATFTVLANNTIAFGQMFTNTWSVSGSELILIRQSGNRASFELGVYDQAGNKLQVIFGGSSSTWLGCDSASLPYYLSVSLCPSP